MGCFVTKKSSLFWKQAGFWLRTMRPVAEWRSVFASILEIAPDPRVARPVAERRWLHGQAACPASALRAHARSSGCRGTTPARHASREARRRAAVIPRPSRMSPYAPARPWRAVRGCRGSAPAQLLTSTRRWAPGASGRGMIWPSMGWPLTVM